MVSERARSNRKRIGITGKLVALILLTTGAVVLFLGAYFPDQQIRASRLALEKKAATYGRLVAQQVASAIAFDDRATAREVFDSVARDEDVQSLVLLRSDGSALHVLGKPGEWISAAKRGVREQKVLDLVDRFAVVTPVVSLEGPRGTLVIELSTRVLDHDRQRITRTALAAGAIALLLGGLLAFLIARSLGSRVRAIADVATRVAGGDLDQKPVSVRGRDEIATLGDAFNAMLSQIQTLLAHIKKSAQEEQERLEGLVSARTAQLDRRNQDMRLVLDNVGQGFLSVDLDGQMSAERSAIVTTWFGTAGASDTFFEYMNASFPGKGDYFRLAFDNLREEWMPLEMRVGQLPSQLECGRGHFGFAYKPLCDGDRIEKLLVVVSDVTAIVERQRSEEEERELVQVMRWIMSDRAGFMNFLSEADELVHAIFAEESDRVLRLRLVHTLKGNAAIFGFSSVFRQCHAFEDRMVESGDDLPIEDRQRLRTHWTRLRERIAPFIDGRKSDVLDVPRKDYERIVNEVKSKSRHSAIDSLLSSWELEPAEARLARLADYAHGLADRLGKGPIDVRVEDNGVRLESQDWARLWQTLVHVVRNAIDHGLETREERAAHGKPELGVLTLRTRITDGRFYVEVEDQGRGVDWGKVAQVARKAGLPAHNQHDLQAALFRDELTTRETATDTSGRGVGLSAVRQVCEETGGHMAVHSQRGRGTTFSFDWAIDPLGRRPANQVELPRTGTGGRH